MSNFGDFEEIELSPTHKLIDLPTEKTAELFIPAVLIMIMLSSLCYTIHICRKLKNSSSGKVKPKILLKSDGPSEYNFLK